MYNTTLYKRLRGVKTRCRNPKSGQWDYYGGRGIKCLWDEFQDFYDDMAESFFAHVKKHGEHNTHLDRIDPNGHYCKENCRWVTRKQNRRNIKNLRMITFNGKTRCLKDWADELGGSKNALHERLRKGWTIEKALTTPIKGHNRKRATNLP